MKMIGDTPDLSVVIPCFNEAENIEGCLRRIHEMVDTTDYLFEIIFVDGGSTDDTSELLLTGVKKRKLENFVKVVSLRQRGGYGHDILHGLSKAKAPVLSWTHADLQTDIADIFKAKKIYDHSQGNNNDLVIKGKRIGRPFFDIAFTFGMQIIALLVLRVNLSDINAQPKLFSKQFYQKYLQTGAPRDFSLDLYLLWCANRYKYQILSFPVMFKAREYGTPKGGGGNLVTKLRLMRRTFIYICKLRKYRPQA